jgi:hypothetical protein
MGNKQITYEEATASISVFNITGGAVWTSVVEHEC